MTLIQINHRPDAAAIPTNPTRVTVGPHIGFALSAATFGSTGADRSGDPSAQDAI